jgi:hypothetical protein
MIISSEKHYAYAHISFHPKILLDNHMRETLQQFERSTPTSRSSLRRCSTARAVDNPASFVDCLAVRFFKVQKHHARI